MGADAEGRLRAAGRVSLHLQHLFAPRVLPWCPYHGTQRPPCLLSTHPSLPSCPSLTNQHLPYLLSTCPAAAAAEGEEAGAEKAAGEEEERKKLEEQGKAYTKFWTGFGKSLKMGLIEDQGNRWGGWGGWELQQIDVT